MVLVVNVEIRFQNVTSYNLNEYKKFVQFHAEKNNFKYNFYTLFIITLLIFCMIMQFCYGKVLVGIGFVFVLVIFLFYRILHPIFLTKKEATSKKVKQHMKNTYTFYDDFAIISNGKDNVKLKYSKFYKVFEENDRFYLYLDKNHSYILLKNNFTIGNADDFYAFIKKKVRRKI
jgi:hypothetical protein